MVLMATPEDWQSACDAVVAELLDAAGILSPPVDALAITSRLAWPVVWDTEQTGRARIQRLEGRPTLFVRPEERPERLQWAVAHEIGEASAWRVCQQADVTWDELGPRQREEIANQVAQRVLIPTEWFRSALQSGDGDLFALKQRFVTASHELIAWRWLDLAEPVIVSVFDHGELSRRRCNFAARAPAIGNEESTCVVAARQAGSMARRAWSDGEAVAWPVHEPTWQREILRTTVEWDACQ
jgi:hypothetical protein